MDKKTKRNIILLIIILACLIASLFILSNMNTAKKATASKDKMNILQFIKNYNEKH